MAALSSYVRTQTAREAPAKINALIEKFKTGAPAAELLVASRALEEQIENLNDGKDWADTTCPLLHQLLALIVAEPATKHVFKVSVARCVVLQLSHMWHYCHSLHAPLIKWVVQNLLCKNQLQDVQAACVLLTELVTCERDQEPDAEDRSVNSEVFEAASDRLEELADLDRSPLHASAGADAQAVAEELLYVLRLDGEPEPPDVVMARVAVYFTAAPGLDTTRALPAKVRDDLLDLNCEFFPYGDLNSGAVAISAFERTLVAAEHVARMHAAVDVALAVSMDGGPSLFACVLRIIRGCPEVPKNLLKPCKQKAVDFALRLAIGVLVAAASDDAQFERALREGVDGDDDALYIVLCAFKVHRFHLYEGNDDQIFYHINRTLRRGVRSAAWAAAVMRTGPIYDDMGTYVDF
jgi:hypothetical protein